MYRRLLTILAVIAMPSCDVDKKTDLNQEEAKIKTLFPDWIQRFMDTRNPDDYFEGVTDDYVIMGCDFEPLTSLDSIRLEIKKLAESDVMIGIEDFQSHEIIIRDDLAIHRYSCFEKVNSKTDTTTQRFGFNYLDVLKKSSDNKWKIHLHMATAKP